MNIFSKINGVEYIKCLLCFTAFFAFDSSEAKSASESTKYKAEAIEKSETLIDSSQKESSEVKDGIVGLIEKISKTKASDLKKPFSDQPGYMQEVTGFNTSVYNMDTKKEFAIADLKGNVVILFFTTTWCPNCPAVFKDLDSLADKLSKSNVLNVKIIPLVIGNDSENYIRNYYKVNDIQSLDVFRPISPSDLDKNINGFPSCVVVNKNGKPVWGFVGITNYASQEFLNFIEALAKEE